ncbi:zinc finger CCHC domain-containing protein 9, partial [Tremellales sp. Uapishka_1]
MARFTSIGLPRKTFVASAAEEATESTGPENQAGPSTEVEGDALADGAGKKKRKRKGKGGAEKEVEQEKWGRAYQIADPDPEARRDPRHAKTTCFACRSVGHAARDCPNVLLAAAGGEGSASMLEGAGNATGKGEKGMKRKKGVQGSKLTGNKCYRCNSNMHSLSGCDQPVDATNPTPFATCFICLQSGHLSSLCPSNPGRGIYPNGGSCKVCGSVAHRASDCPDDKRGTKKEKKSREIVLGTGTGAGADEDDFMVEKREEFGSRKNTNKRHAPAKNGERGPAKKPKPEEKVTEAVEHTGEQETRVAEAQEVVRKPVVQKAGKSKAKVVKF